VTSHVPRPGGRQDDPQVAVGWGLNLDNTGKPNPKGWLLPVEANYMAGLNAFIKSWLDLNENIDKQQELARTLGDPKYIDRLKTVEQRIEKQKGLRSEADKKMVAARGTLLRFYRRNRVWFSKATCAKLDAVVIPQGALIDRLDPEAHTASLEFAKRLDALQEDMAPHEQRVRLRRKGGGDLCRRTDQELGEARRTVLHPTA
jgi:hypothetical protein